jgi:hypothetical protein
VGVPVSMGPPSRPMVGCRRANRSERPSRRSKPRARIRPTS